MIKIRRYCGYDCDSINGFNNGYYVDDEPIEAADEADAMRLCLEAMAERWNTRNADNTRSEDFEELDNGYQLITGYYDNDGNPFTRAQFIDANENEETGSYSYVYVTYEVVND